MPPLRRTLPILFAPLLAYSAARAEECGLKLVTTVDIQRSLDGAVRMPATLNGRSTALVLDTGAFWSVVRQGLTDGLTVKPAPVESRGVGGGSLEYYVTTSMTLGRLTIPKVDLMVAPDAMTKDPAIGGNLAANLLKGFDVEIDPAGGRVNLFSQDHCKGQVVYWPHGDLVKVPLNVGPVGELTIPVGLDGKGATALLDTGSSLSLLGLDAVRRMFGLSTDSPGMELVGEGATLDGKGVQAYRYRFKALVIEGITFYNPVLTIGDDRSQGNALERRYSRQAGLLPHDLLLGMHQLRQLHLYFAYGEKTLYATTVAGDAAAKPAGATEATATPRTADPLDLGEAQKLWKSAGDHLAKQEADAAIHDYDAAIQVAPGVAPLYVGRGAAYAMKRSFPQAMADFAKAIALDATSADAYSARATAEYMTGDLARAQRDLDTAIKLDPTSARAYGIRGTLHANRGETDAAMADFDRAIQLDPSNGPALYGRGMLKKQKGDVQGAAADIAAAKQANPAMAQLAK